jgi:hypothetical protein
LDWDLHEIPAKAGNRNIAMFIHVFVLFAKELNVGLRVLTAKGEGEEEIVVVFFSVFEKQFEEADEARGVF